MLNILFPRDWRHCRNWSHWHCFDVTTSRV